jgi:phosphate transport system protein
VEVEIDEQEASTNMEASDLTDHISRRFNKDIEDLRNAVLSMGGLVESQLSQAITAIVSGDSELGLQVAKDDYKVNNFEVDIDEECGRILATRGPTAGDLRLIVAIIKTITDLERIGDEAEKIGFLASKLAAMDRPPDSYRELKTLGQHVAHNERIRATRCRGGLGSRPGRRACR